MARIVVSPDRLRQLATQLQGAGGDLRGVQGRLGGALSRLDWEARQKAAVDGRVGSARSQAGALADQIESLSRYLASKAQAFEAADSQGAADLQAVSARYLEALPTPVPTPAPGGQPQGDGGGASIDDAIKALDDILKPIDWIHDSTRATRAFNAALENIGRLLNAITGQRGHIKLMRELGDVLNGTTKAVSAASDLLSLKDMNRFFAGELTNSQIADTAIKALFPIPIINDRVAQWLIANMPDPTGHWRGLAPSVE